VLILETGPVVIRSEKHVFYEKNKKRKKTLNKKRWQINNITQTKWKNSPEKLLY